MRFEWPERDPEAAELDAAATEEVADAVADDGVDISLLVDGGNLQKQEWGWAPISLP